MLRSAEKTKSYQAQPQPHELSRLEYNVLSGASEHVMTKSLSAFHSRSKTYLAKLLGNW